MKTSEQQPFDWKPVFHVIGILIKFLFRYMQDKKKNERGKAAQ